MRKGTRLQALLAAVVLVAGCGGQSESPVTPASLALGRTIFQSGSSPACSLCHTIAAAKMTSPLGPNLNAEMSEADTRQLTDAQLAKSVLQLIATGECLDPNDASRCMPKALVTGARAADVAMFVAVCGRDRAHAGCEPAAGALRGEALDGEQLYLTRGCVGCHFGPGATGPPLTGVSGSRVTLTNGQTVTADRAYLIESIAQPDSQVVAGYQPGMMSARIAAEGITRAQIDALVDYIQTLR